MCLHAASFQEVNELRKRHGTRGIHSTTRNQNILAKSAVEKNVIIWSQIRTKPGTVLEELQQLFPTVFSKLNTWHIQWYDKVLEMLDAVQQKDYLLRRIVKSMTYTRNRSQWRVPGTVFWHWTSRWCLWSCSKILTTTAGELCSLNVAHSVVRCSFQNTKIKARKNCKRCHET